MIAPIQSWKEETHSVPVELMRHFLSRFFDSDLTARSGEWQKVAAGLLAALLAAGVLVVKSYSARYTLQLHEYAAQSGIPAAQLYPEWVRGDLLAFIALAMAATAVVALLQWRSLFPTAGDVLALAGLPVTARQIFGAKFAVLLMLFAVFVAAMCGPVAVCFAAATAGPYQADGSSLAIAWSNFATLAGACAFTFFSLLGVQGVLLNALPARWFERASLAVQGGLFIVVVGAIPLVGHQPSDAWWWPAVWFLHPQHAGAAAAAVVIPMAVALAVYVSAYRRYRRVLLETASRGRAPAMHWVEWLLDRVIPDARERAAFAFIAKTLARSSVHRLLMLAYAGIAFGWTVSGVIDTPRSAASRSGRVWPRRSARAARIRDAGDGRVALRLLASGRA